MYLLNKQCKMKTMKYLYILSSFLLLLGCGGNNDDDIDQEALNKAIKQANYAPIILERGGIKLTEVYNIPKFENITLSLETNKQRFKLGENNIEFKAHYFNIGENTVNEKDFVLPNKSRGQYLGLVKNEEEISPEYSNTILTNVDTGSNYYFGYLSRSYDISLKTDSSSFLMEIKADKNGVSFDGKLNDPAYLLLKPTGTYSGISKEKIILDFFLKNISIGTNGNYAIISIDKIEFKINKWSAFEISGLKNGKHTISLALFDKTGKKLNTLFPTQCKSEIELQNINLFEE